jgi:hypothetical protein
LGHFFFLIFLSKTISLWVIVSFSIHTHVQISEVKTRFNNFSLFNSSRHLYFKIKGVSK